MKHIPKPFNNEEAEKFLVKGAYATTCMVGFLQHPGDKAISDQQTHCCQYKERREIGVPLFSRPPLLNSAEEWLDFRTMRLYCQTHLFHLKRPGAVDR
jgi:hypothetical protein